MPEFDIALDTGMRKAEQEKQRKETAIANTTGIRILAAITAAVPVRLMKRDLLFVVERLASLLDENRLAVVARQHGIKKAKDGDSIGKLFAAYLRRAEESALGGPTGRDNHPPCGHAAERSTGTP
jgi:ParB family chromosome partitioning protein